MEEIIGISSRAPQVAIRPMRAADIDRIVAIADALPMAPHWPRQAYQDALDSSSNMKRIALVAEGMDAILGFVILGLVVPEAELESIAVAPEAQRHGVGRLLLEGASAAARSQRASIIFLEIRVSNLPAAALYRKAGFQEAGRRRGYYSNPIEDAILMELSPL